MTKRKTNDGVSAPVQAAPEPQPDFQDDEYRGHGGSYIIDPATGKRIRVEGPGMEADNGDVEPATETSLATEAADES